MDFRDFKTKLAEVAVLVDNIKIKYAEVAVLVDNIKIKYAEVAVLVDNIKIKYAEVAQLVEHSPEERGVTSSNLVLGTKTEFRKGWSAPAFSIFVRAQA